MPTWADVSRLALALPEAEEGTTSGGRNRAWTVRAAPDAPEAWLARAPKRLVRAYLAESADA